MTNPSNGVIPMLVSTERPNSTAQQLARVPFYQLFGLHAILFIFLLVWWLLTKRPPLDW